jgi:hypothetical protein
LATDFADENKIKWESNSVRKELEAWGEKYRKNLIVNDFKQILNEKKVKPALVELSVIGRSLFKAFFGNIIKITSPLISYLMNNLEHNIESELFQVVSEDLLLPWQLMYWGESDSPFDKKKFLGMCFQVEHILVEENGLAWNNRPHGKTMAGFYCTELPDSVIDHHQIFFSRAVDADTPSPFFHSNSDLLAELKGRGLDRTGLYFYCHGSFDDEDDSKTWIRIESDTNISLSDLRDTKIILRKDCVPLIFINNPWIFLNACECGQIGTYFFKSISSFFLKDKKASCYISPEISMPQYFGAEFANKFFAKAKQNPQPVHRLLYDLRKEYFMDRNNPLGLFYNLYSNAEYWMEIPEEVNPN